jgi:hypothetical protein
MKIINYIIAGSLFILVSVIVFKAVDHHRFRTNAARWASPSFNGSNLIAADTLEKIHGDKLLIALDEKSAMDNSISIAPEKILEKENVRKIRKFNGKIVLISQNPSESARIWMLLSQMGIRNLYILTT